MIKIAHRGNTIGSNPLENAPEYIDKSLSEGYEAEIDNPSWNPSDPEANPQRISNPETQSQFANRMTRDYLMSNTVAYELKLERESVPKPTPPNITDPN